MNVYSFSIPESLNSIQLKDELKAESVYILEDKLYIHGEMTIKDCETAIANHVPQLSPQELNYQRKMAILDKLGLTADEAAALLA